MTNHAVVTSCDVQLHVLDAGRSIQIGAMLEHRSILSKYRKERMRLREAVLKLSVARIECESPTSDSPFLSRLGHIFPHTSTSLSCATETHSPKTHSCTVVRQLTISPNESQIALHVALYMASTGSQAIEIRLVPCSSSQWGFSDSDLAENRNCNMVKEKAVCLLALDGFRPSWSGFSIHSAELLVYSEAELKAYGRM